MYIKRVPNRNSPPAILLRESYREDGKVKKRNLANLSHWSAEKVEQFQANAFSPGTLLFPRLANLSPPASEISQTDACATLSSARRL